MKSVFQKCYGLMAALALSVTAMDVNSACTFFIHQPKLPAGAEKLSKING